MASYSAKNKSVRAQLHKIRDAVLVHESRCGVVKELKSLASDGCRLIVGEQVLIDPWDNEILLVTFGNGRALISVGADGFIGTQDDVWMPVSGGQVVGFPFRTQEFSALMGFVILMLAMLVLAVFYFVRARQSGKSG